MGRRRGGLETALLFGLLGGWLGAMLFFLGVVAPAAFALLPSPELAGRMVSRSLAVLNLAGAGAGTLLALLALLRARGAWLVLLPLGLAAISLVSHFGVSASLAELRASGALEVDPSSFDRLHRLSVVLFGITLIGCAVLLGLHARVEARSPGNPRENVGNP